jgi:hypothetical protein
MVLYLLAQCIVSSYRSSVMWAILFSIIEKVFFLSFYWQPKPRTFYHNIYTARNIDTNSRKKTIEKELQITTTDYLQITTTTTKNCIKICKANMIRSVAMLCIFYATVQKNEVDSVRMTRSYVSPSLTPWPLLPIPIWWCLFLVYKIRLTNFSLNRPPSEFPPEIRKL